MYAWNPTDYAHHSCGQERWARELLATTVIDAEEQILDIGCGDGRITRLLAEQASHGRVLGIDSSAAMIRHACAQHLDPCWPGLSYQQGDARNLPFDNEFTLVFSNATLHWVRDHRPVLLSISRALRDDGRLVAQMGGAGNGAQLIAVFDALRKQPQWRHYFADFESVYGFHHPDDYVRWLAAADLTPSECRLIDKEMIHDSRSAFTGWIRTAWHPYTSMIPAPRREQFIDEVATDYLRAHPADAQGHIHVTMTRLNVQARRLPR